MITKIKDKNKLLAIIIKPNYLKKKGIHFFTPNKLSQQVAFMSHKKNHLIKPHIHKKRLKKIYDTNDCLFIMKGEMQVDFYNTRKKYLKSKILKKNYIFVDHKIENYYVLLECNHLRANFASSTLPTLYKIICK